MLEGKRVTKRFGGLVALDNVDFHVEENEIVGLLGPNGSGKTTLFNCITGVYKPESGNIIFKGEDISRLSSYEVARKGISRTFQLIKIFPQMSVLNNMLIAQSSRIGLFDFWKEYTDEEIEKANKILASLDLLDFKNFSVSSLSAGEQKILEFSMALASDPEIMLLDEITSGISYLTIEKIRNQIVASRDEGKTFFMIEHNIRFILGSGICDRVYVLDHGNKIAEGTPKEIQTNEKVIDAYFGK